MNNVIHRRLTWAFGALAGVAILLLLRAQFELNTVKSDIRFARDLSETFYSYRDQALKGDVSEGIFYLRKLEVPRGAEPFQNVVADFVERERLRAVKDIIAYLRVRTSKDLGETSDAWIKEYGSK
jgi:hypothetical protein